MRGERFTFDFVIAATGHINDFKRRGETSALADKIALWRDRFTPPQGEEYAPAGTYPYLGRNFEFTEKTPGQAPYLHHIHCFTLGVEPGGVGGSVPIDPEAVGAQRVDGHQQDICPRVRGTRRRARAGHHEANGDTDRGETERAS